MTNSIRSWRILSPWPSFGPCHQAKFDPATYQLASYDPGIEWIDSLHYVPPVPRRFSLSLKLYPWDS
ncbi:hypothetical protein HGRIS_002943 [Hohenbuehelia grisea]|uniref:Uncharacterized protein n=1 Tax=Hohenbuehelia grisea TaxID=104357 RepID=A0ABR3JM60_9AGAR